MFLDEPIVKMNDGRLNYEHERSIVCKWFKYCGFEYYQEPFGKSEGFYIISNKKKNRKVYLCCTRDLGKRNVGKFWLGMPSTHISGNADTGVILILVWEDRKREYLVLNNKEILKLRNLWYVKDNYFSVDIDVVGGKYLMRGKENYKSDYRFALNNILLIFD